MSDLINTLEAPGEFDALTTLRPGEPYFLLCGRDRSAPPIIREWAAKRRRQTHEEFDGGKITTAVRERELRKCTQAEMIAESMVEYKNDWTTSQVEQPEKAKAYTGHELPEETQRRDALQSARARAASAVHNAIANLNDLLPHLDKQAELHGPEADAAADEANLVREALDEMRALAGDIEPKRPVAVAA